MFHDIYFLLCYINIPQQTIRDGGKKDNSALESKWMMVKWYRNIDIINVHIWFSLYNNFEYQLIYNIHFLFHYATTGNVIILSAVNVLYSATVGHKLNLTGFSHMTEMLRCESKSIWL